MMAVLCNWLTLKPWDMRRIPRGSTGEGRLAPGRNPARLSERITCDLEKVSHDNLNHGLGTEAIGLWETLQNQ